MKFRKSILTETSLNTDTVTSCYNLKEENEQMCLLSFFCSGVGLFIGMELVKDRVSRKPATEEAAHFVRRYLKFFFFLSFLHLSDNCTF